MGGTGTPASDSPPGWPFTKGAFPWSQKLFRLLPEAPKETDLPEEGENKEHHTRALETWAPAPPLQTRRLIPAPPDASQQSRKWEPVPACLHP